MNNESPKNTVAEILHGYAWVNAFCGVVAAIYMADNFVADALIVLELSAVIVASFLIYAFGEVIQLLHEIKLNTEKRTESIPDELPEL